MLAFTGKYWLMMAPLVKHSLVQRYGREFASQTMRRAKSVYREMLERVDDIGNDNPMAFNIYTCFVFLAVWKAANGRISRDGLREITEDMMRFPPLRLMGVFVNMNTPRGVRIVRKMMHKNAAWLDKHPEYNGVSWDFNFDDGKRRDGFYYYFTQCPLEAFARREGLLDILPVMCEIDHLTAGLLHAVLHRESTLASGGAVCDYWFYGDRITDPQ